MPWTPKERQRILLRTMAPWRRLLPKRTVRRHVQGVDLVLPWVHALPDFAKVRASYGQNLVELAAGLHQHDGGAGPLRVLDIGANVGDTALQIAHRVDARVLCVEGDPYWAGYLHRNVDTHAGITVVEALLAPDATSWGDSSPVREGGTTRFVQDSEGQGSLPSLPAGELRARHPDFDQLRLLKCDTDGFDPILVPAAAEAWRDRGPVLFFEFDPGLARKTGDAHPERLWERLAELGYSNLAIWDNVGDPLGQLSVTDAAEQAKVLEPRPVHLGFHFWDVAACRADDTSARATFDALAPGPYTLPSAP